METMLNVLDRVFLGNTLSAWAWAIGSAIVVFVVAWFARQLLLNRARAFAKRRPTGLASVLPHLVLKTGVTLVLIAALVVGTFQLVLPARVERVVQAVVVVLIVLQLAAYGIVLIDAGIAEFMRRNKTGQDSEDASLATSMIAVRILALAIFFAGLVLLALENLGVDVTAMIAGLGVGGIAVALALQNVLGDLFGSLSIVLDKPFVVGDFIIVGDKLGTVEKIGLKTTRLRSLGGEQLIFANSDLLSSRIQNYKRMNERRIVFSFGVEYGTAVEKLEAIPGVVRKAIESQERTRFDRAHFKAFGDSSLDFEVVYYMLVPDYNAYMDVQQAVNLALFRNLTGAGISFAFPTRTLHLASATPLAVTRDAEGDEEEAGCPRPARQGFEPENGARPQG